jgi:hypothetical protein
MKTYFDGEEREIVAIVPQFLHSNGKSTVFMVVYKRGESTGQLLVPAKDELDAMRKFPDELERLSKNYED